MHARQCINEAAEFDTAALKRPRGRDIASSTWLASTSPAAPPGQDQAPAWFASDSKSLDQAHVLMFMFHSVCLLLFLLTCFKGNYLAS